MWIHQRSALWACLAMLSACRTGLRTRDAGAPANSSDSPNETAPATLCDDVAQVAAGLLHVCALKGDGTVWCWGANGYGQLGDATLDDKAAPVPVTALGADVVQVTAGDNATCALKRDGTLWCWGANSSGQLGNGTTTDSSTPTQVVALGSTVAEVAAGRDRRIPVPRAAVAQLTCVVPAPTPQGSVPFARASVALAHGNLHKIGAQARHLGWRGTTILPAPASGGRRGRDLRPDDGWRGVVLGKHQQHQRQFRCAARPLPGRRPSREHRRGRCRMGARLRSHGRWDAVVLGPQ